MEATMEKVKDFSSDDRCDKCSSQAYHEVTSPKTGFELLLCSHHMEENRAYFIINRWTIQSDVSGLESIGYNPVKV
jgi:hypothetical protein